MINRLESQQTINTLIKAEGRYISKQPRRAIYGAVFACYDLV